MTVKTMHTDEVKELLNRVAGLDKAEGNPRVKTIVHRIVHDIFQAVEDLDITPEEFWSAVYYFNRLGQNGEAALLAPGLGMDRYLDIRMDIEDAQAGRDGGTPRTIEGPLYVAGAPLSEGFARMDDGKSGGETMLLTGQVTDEQGNPIANAVVDIWHADIKGAYSYFDPTQSEYNLRRRIKTDAEGRYTARSIIPSGYAVPPEGSTNEVLKLLGRHGRRPAHIHFFVSKPGYTHLTTQINLAGDEYTYDDFAFATKEDLVVPANTVTEPGQYSQYDVPTPFKKVVFDIKLLPASSEEEQQRHARLRALES